MFKCNNNNNNKFTFEFYFKNYFKMFNLCHGPTHDKLWPNILFDKLYSLFEKWYELNELDHT